MSYDCNGCEVLRGDARQRRAWIVCGGYALMGGERSSSDSSWIPDDVINNDTKMGSRKTGQGESAKKSNKISNVAAHATAIESRESA